MKKINWKTHFIELITVVIGISLAFMLNRNYEEAKATKKSYESLKTIIDELKRNDTLVVNGLKYHTSLLSQIREDPKLAVMSIKPSNLSNLAWDLSKSTELSNLVEYDLYLRLTELYSFQSVLLATNTEAGQLIASVSVYSNMMIDFYYSLGLVDENKIVESPISWKSGWTGIFEDIIAMETLLSNEYPRIINELELIRE